MITPVAQILPISIPRKMEVAFVAKKHYVCVFWGPAIFILFHKQFDLKQNLVVKDPVQQQFSMGVIEAHCGELFELEGLTAVYAMCVFARKASRQL